ncbi:MAG: hypothetical protein HPY74_19355 [Firmicutes bacterium]|nr:hypothetical protein [Bacillota bacterium]NSW92767.1 hypothetical protein [Bacillota bacterium]
MNNKLFIIIVLVLSLSIIGVLGYKQFSGMPKVSNSESKQLLIEYKKNLEDLYAELNTEYSRLAAEKDPEKWEDFSAQWMPKLLNVRPEVMGSKFPNGYEEIKIELMTAQSDFMPLWAEYNKDFSEQESDGQKIEELKNRIENILNSVEI